MVIGITGGVGTGKSTILDHLEKKYNAAVILADDVAKDLMKPGQPAYHAVVSEFGTDILSGGPGTAIDSGILSGIVFSDEEKLKKLNALTHPLVKQRILELISAYKHNNVRIIVVEAALLIQAGYLDFLDELWVVQVDYAVRIERLRISRGYSKEKTDSIIANQMSSQEMASYADFIIDNSGDMEETQRQIDEYLSSVNIR